MKKLLTILLLFLSLQAFPYRYWYVAGNGSGTWTGNFYADSTSLVTPSTDPTATDDVYFGVLSGTGTCTVSANSNCRNLDMHGFGGSFTVSGNISFYGDVYLQGTISGSSSFFFKNTSGSNTFTSNGKTTGGFLVDGSGGTIKLTDALTTGIITITNGIFDLNGKNVNCLSIGLGTGTKKLKISSDISTMTITGSNGLNFGGGSSGFTLENGDSLNLTFTSSTPSTYWGNSKDYRIVRFTGSNLSVTGRAYALVCKALIIKPSISSTSTSSVCPSSISITVSDSICFQGASQRYRLQVINSTIGTALTITNNGSSTVIKNCDFRDITGAGSASWDLSSNTSIGDALGNTSITFPTARTLYWRKTGGTGSWSDTTCWGGTYSSSGGADLASQGIPLAQDSVIFDANSITAGSKTITIDCNNLGKGIDFSGLTNTPTISIGGSQSCYLYGNLKLGSSQTWSGNVNNNLYFCGRLTTHTLTSAGKTIPFRMQMSSYGGKYTLQDNCVFTGNNVCTQIGGTIATNGHNLTLWGIEASTAISGSNAGLMFSGTDTVFFTTTGSGVSFNNVNFTLTSASGVLKFIGSSLITNISCNFGGKTLNNVWFAPNTTSTSYFYQLIGSSSTLNNLKFDAGVMVQFVSGQNLNINTLTCTGTQANPIILHPSANTSVATLTDLDGGTNNLTHTLVMGITASGATFNLGEGCMNGGGTTGWTNAWTKPKVISAFNLNGANTDAEGYATMTSTSVTYGAGIAGQGAVYSASSMMISNNTIMFPQGNATILAWVKVSDFSSIKYPVSLYHGITNDFVSAIGTNSYFRMSGSSNFWTDEAPALSSTQWNLIGATVDFQAPQATTYYVVNGVIRNPSSTTNGTSVNRGTLLGIGAKGGINVLVGTIDEVRYYNGLVTPAFFKNEYTYRKGFMQ